MKLRYKAQKNSRFKRRLFDGVKLYTGYHLYFEEFGMFLNVEDINICSTRSSYFKCTNVRKFRRILRKMSSFLKSGTDALLDSNYIGYNVYGKIK